jgi:prepilin-type N-terminal cleavage/methylation domain-containing protein
VHTTNLKKYSFTLIEIIIAMVIVGIAVTAIPMLLNSSSNSMATSLKEDSFFNAYSTISLIQTLNWDENNTKDDKHYKVLTSPNGDSELKCKRNGIIQLNNKSGADCDDNTTSHIGIDDGEDRDDVTTFDDIDDFNGYEIDSFSKYKIKIALYYIDDTADYSKNNIFFNDNKKVAHDSNIKQIELNITDKNDKVFSIFRFESFNIGKVKVYSRDDL